MPPHVEEPLHPAWEIPGMFSLTVTAWAPATAAVLAGAFCLGWSIPAAATAAIARLPSVAPSLDRGIWVVTEPDDDTAIFNIATRGAAALVQRRAGGDLRLGRCPAASWPGAAPSTSRR